MKNPHAVSLGKLGGSVSSPAKTKANQKKIQEYWDKKKNKKNKKSVDTIPSV
jgi:hypothetical protein